MFWTALQLFYPNLNFYATSPLAHISLISSIPLLTQPQIKFAPRRGSLSKAHGTIFANNFLGSLAASYSIQRGYYSK